MSDQVQIPVSPSLGSLAKALNVGLVLLEVSPRISYNTVH